MTENRLPRRRRTQLERLADLWLARWKRDRIRERGGRMHDAAIDPDLDPACASLCAAIPATPPMPRKRRARKSRSRR